MSAPVEYREVRHEGLVVFRWSVREDEAGVAYVATGSCPVCRCEMTRSYGFVQPPLAKGGFLGRRKDPGPGAWHTSCRCESLHLSRPAEEPRGCGAFFPIAPPPSGDPAGGSGA
ncbi:hypothetical protein [Streptomyces physcomitrii]|uniref:Uncharacterized protein n=1 Tax=Streptomyces physcomitrii TaxID=2724184 RepID=A0ABX1H019_9ACTN|nr:hypothetical protein [Streptomyces physcomitrii]NKI41343.1 hypothetical protein [Streptomyces physcomitrii]